MGKRQGRLSTSLQVEQLENRETPANSIWMEQSFESIPLGSFPTDWRQWNSRGTGQFEVSNAQASDGKLSLSSRNTMPQASRAWINQEFPADYGIAANFYVNSPQPMQLFVRGSRLDSFLPSYYAVSVTRGLTVELLRVVHGNARPLATLQANVDLNNRWLRVVLKPTGNQITVQLIRLDTQQFLHPSGRWQTDEVSVFAVADDAISGPGFIGINRPDRNGGAVYFDQVQVLAPDGKYDFDGVPIGTLPSGWSEWTSHAIAAFRVNEGVAYSPSRSLGSDSPMSTATARAWLSNATSANVQVGASMPLDSALPLRLLVRGSDLNGAAPSYYALQVSRGIEASLLFVDRGNTFELAKVRSATYVSNVWVRATVRIVDNRLQATIFRLDTRQFLRPDGQWQSAMIPALDVQDSRWTQAGFVGVERPALYAGRVTLDDFESATVVGDATPPAVRIDHPRPGSTVSNQVTIRASVADSNSIDRTEFWLDGKLRYTTPLLNPTWDLDTRTLANGSHQLEVRAYDSAGNIGLDRINFEVANESVPVPTIPRHYPHIRIAMLAYSGTPFTDFESRLLRESVDLVIPKPQYLGLIDSRAPDTPQLIYTNISNIYGTLLNEWFAYADAKGLDREVAFYHASQPISWSGASPSSIPVTWFWSVYRGADLERLTDLTSASRNMTIGDIPFGTAGESLYLGYPERFREINFQLLLGRSNGWSGLIEYAVRVDASGRPVEWKPLPILMDTTNRFARSGKIEFDPPADWRPARIGTSAQLFYVRIRTVTGGNPPVGTTILGRNYSQSNGASSPKGIIPAFDFSADLNRDGYLNDAEYARRAPGKDARFLYESRVYYPYYGESRYVINPSSPELRLWLTDYHIRFLEQNPIADGLFVDNSGGRFPLRDLPLTEAVGSYTDDYAALLEGINRAIAPRWLAVNTAGGGVETDAVIRATPMWFEEFAIRPLSHNYTQVLDLATTLRRRQSVKSPSPYVILDTLPTGGSPTDSRTMLASLAYYYLLADPEKTFFLYNGGYSPNSSWVEHWVPAAAFNIGLPKEDFSLFATGKDPKNANLTYQVFQREYDNALVLYKPLSYALGRGNGSLGDGTATTHRLNGTYRILNALGQLSGPVTSVRLRNGEGVILIKS